MIQKPKGTYDVYGTYGERIQYLEKLLSQNIIEIYSTFNIEERRKFWLKIIDKIYIENGKIKEVTFL